MTEVDINFWSVLVAAIASMVVGFVWYSPAVFGKQWMKLSGITEADIKKDSANKAYMFSFVAALITAYVLEHVLQYVGASNASDGAKAGFWMWLGFVATTTSMDSLFGEKPWKLNILQNGHQLVSLIVMGIILAMWK